MIAAIGMLAVCISNYHTEATTTDSVLEAFGYCSTEVSCKISPSENRTACMTSCYNATLFLNDEDILREYPECFEGEKPIIWDL